MQASNYGEEIKGDSEETKLQRNKMPYHDNDQLHGPADANQSHTAQLIAPNNLFTLQELIQSSLPEQMSK